MLPNHEILSEQQRQLSRIYLEHDPPQTVPTDTRHVVDDPDVTIVQVTHSNRLMWTAAPRRREWLIMRWSPLWQTTMASSKGNRCHKRKLADWEKYYIPQLPDFMASSIETLVIVCTYKSATPALGGHRHDTSIFRPGGNAKPQCSVGACVWPLYYK